jgi:hypothetical protein
MIKYLPLTLLPILGLIFIYYNFSTPTQGATLPRGEYVGEVDGSVSAGGYDGIYVKESNPYRFAFRRGNDFNVSGNRVWRCKGNCKDLALDQYGEFELNNGNPIQAGDYINLVIIDDDDDDRTTNLLVGGQVIANLSDGQMWKSISIQSPVSGVPVIDTQDSIGIIYASFGAQVALDCAGNCSEKLIGTNNPFNNFSPLSTLIEGEEYWVKITTKGRTIIDTSQQTTQTTYAGADIMLIQDFTGSMKSGFPLTPNGSNSDTNRFEAAKASLLRFLELSDPDKDYLGYGGYSYCNSFRANNGVDINWVYRDTSPIDNQARDYGVLLNRLNPLDQNLQSVQTNINNIFMLSSGRSSICYQKADYRNRGTTVGAGMTIGLTQLTPILDDTDASSYRLSSQGSNGGPRSRNDLDGTPIPKFIVIASDGKENVPPYALSSQEIDREGRTIIETAQHYGVKVYTLLIGSDDSQAKTLMQEIANRTGGQYYGARDQQTLINSYESIRSQITTESTTDIFVEQTTSSTLQENINNEYFEILPLEPGTSFRLYQDTAGTKTDLTANCATPSDCGVTQADASSISINLPEAGSDTQFDVYFKVRSTQPSTSDVLVDQNSSSITYSDSYSEPLDNYSVIIDAVNPFFQTSNGGNIYSQSSITNLLPADTALLQGTPPGILTRADRTPPNLSQGYISSTNWDAQIPPYNTTTLTYENLRDPLNKIQDGSSITNPQNLDSGIYQVQGDLTINSPWNYSRDDTRSRKHTIFVNGDLYINSPILIPASGTGAGQSGVIFIVKGSIGINTTLRDADEVHGIYIAKGVIDTACNSSFTGQNICTSSLEERKSNLTLQGSFASLQGFSLERRGKDNENLRGENFIFRPDLLLFAAQQLGTVNYRWQEIEP